MLRFCVPAVVLCLLCLGCSGTNSSFDKIPQLRFEDISATYASNVQERGFGQLFLTIEKVEDTRTVYTATMLNQDGGGAEELEGVGTLTNDHIILNFDRGEDSDFYFEGFVTEQDAGGIYLDGQFIFPDNGPNLEAAFILTGPVS